MDDIFVELFLNLVCVRFSLKYWCRVTSSSQFRIRDPELEKALQEKDDRIEALEKLMGEEKEDKKRRDVELVKFMKGMHAKFPPSY
ncbi:unnamed protein product [Arabidopsis halleri]